MVDTGKLPEGSSKINRLSLNRCPPYTEIFSKRRKIYSVCVESLSMPLHLTQKFPAESWIQTTFASTVVPRCRSVFRIRWRCECPKSAGKWQFVLTRHVQLCLLWFLPAPSTLAFVQWPVIQDGGRAVKRFPPAQTLYCHNWHKRAGRMERILLIEAKTLDQYSS